MTKRIGELCCPYCLRPLRAEYQDIGPFRLVDHKHVSDGHMARMLTCDNHQCDAYGATVSGDDWMDTLQNFVHAKRAKGRSDAENG